MPLGNNIHIGYTLVLYKKMLNDDEQWGKHLSSVINDLTKMLHSLLRFFSCQWYYSNNVINFIDGDKKIPKNNKSTVSEKTIKETCDLISVILGCLWLI